ncbi:uncharacterized protein LOC108099138 isoform X1 [Drosophila ficusphila]|uniref:uncharacterized protein LOC108099138 isoform X1 n=1 Tax=Drosophila ficusphila TaxID=30025 RepID=UPI0007E69E6F|nr:uncharacterized protein LOC108099138 isoform X1 [Drosophila ficusphila]
MEKKANIADSLQTRLFALGPAPPGFQPPNASFFASLEAHLRKAIRFLIDTNRQLQILRKSLQTEKNRKKRQTYKEKMAMFAKEQLRAEQLILKYRSRLMELQEAEISKVTKHLEQMDKVLGQVNIRLGYLRTKIKAETDPKRREIHVCNSFFLVREQHKTKGLCERWRDRLGQLTRARIRKEKPMSVRIPNSAPKPQEKPTADAQKPKEVSGLEASEPKADQKEMIETGCQRCAALVKESKPGQPKICSICSKWSKDNNTTKPKVTIYSKEVSQSFPITSKEEQLNKSNPEKLTEIEKKEKGANSKASVNEDWVVPMILDVRSETMTAVKEEPTTSKDLIAFQEVAANKDLIDSKTVSSIQNSLKSIDSKNMALAHVKILQEYAMLNDNFRAIGLLTEVEKSILNPPQNEDFDL